MYTSSGTPDESYEVKNRQDRGPGSPGGFLI